MSKEKILITGYKGTIGKILQKGLTDFQITGLDLPDGDTRNYEIVEKAAVGKSAIVHLAWDTQTDNYLSGKINPDNSSSFYNVYQAARTQGVPRVIVASSVHADSFYKWEGPGLMSPDQNPTPDSPYGAHKVYMEAMGRHFSKQGLEVVVVRFGGISLDDRANRDILPERAVFLSQRDGVSLMRLLLRAEKIPDNFAIVYAVSNNSNRIHDISNPFGWVPEDNAENFLD